MANRTNERNHELTKKEIVNCTRQIILDEGIEGVSIRKITKMMGYSSGIIYHYFADKDEIIQSIVLEGYQNIINSVMVNFLDYSEPIEAMRAGVKAYVTTAYQFGFEYHRIMTNKDSKIIEHTKILSLESFDDNRALKLMQLNLEMGVSSQIYREMNTVEMTKFLWTSIFGFTLKLIIDDYGLVERDALIESFVNYIIEIIKR